MRPSQYGEAYFVGGKKHRVKDPLLDGSPLVWAHHPGAHPEGSTAHWAWSMDWNRQGEAIIVAEAWPVRGSHDWWVRVAKNT